MESIDCVVVGAGPAGLAASTALRALGVDHVVIERGRVADTWRTQRWDSFRLNTPGWMNRMLGDQDDDAHLGGPEVVERLEALGADLPVRDGVEVIRLTPAGGHHELHTSDGTIRARAVIVATGDQNAPFRPTSAARLSDRIAQYHTADYRNPDQLPPGGVLVVGSAQSGCQITEDLIAAGRRVVLATSRVGRIPTPYRGRPAVDWIGGEGFFDQRPEEVPDPNMLHATNPVSGAGGRFLSLQQLARRGVRIAGRLVGVNSERVSFDDSAAANVAAGDAFAVRVRGMIDDIIRRGDYAAPPAHPDSDAGPIELDPPRTLDLRAEGIGTVIWCTGFSGDFTWLDPALIDHAGAPRRVEAASTVAGVWFVGLRWLVTRASELLYGIPRDAATVANAVRAHVQRS